MTPFNLEQTYRRFGGTYMIRSQSRKMVFQKISTCIQGVIFQKAGIFMVTTVKTQNLVK